MNMEAKETNQAIVETKALKDGTTRNWDMMAKIDHVTTIAI